MICVPSEDSDQPGHPPSLISAFAVWVAKGPKFLQADSKDRSDWASAQADLTLHWAHRSFCWICIGMWLIYDALKHFMDPPREFNTIVLQLLKDYVVSSSRLETIT